MTPTVPATLPDPAVVLGRMFASRAEQLKDRVFSFYETPTYFPELLTEAPCVLVGGRGTGKTTVLKGLSYHGQQKLHGDRPIETWPYYGVYLRINTGRVAAFAGPELEDADWQRAFIHYVNLLLCESTLAFIDWYSNSTGATELIGSEAVCAVAECLGVETENFPEDASGLRKTVGSLKRRFESYINTVGDHPKTALSALGAPVDELVGSLMAATAMQDKLFFFLLDEYENLTSPQQRVLNTLIKHAGEHYTFKIGVKELGWRAKSTLNSEEQLQAPADYAAININERLEAPGVFQSFAANVCQERLGAVAKELEMQSVLDLRALLPRLSEDQEAQMLGVEEHTAIVRDRILAENPQLDLAVFDSLPALYGYLIGFWAESHSETSASAYEDFLANAEQWNGRYSNYKHALLFTLKAGRRGTRKYYTGFDTLVELAGDNIRFLVQLVEQSLREQLLDVEADWLHTPVQPTHTTVATHNVAQRHLVELEGLSLIGPRITRLCVGLGRIFQLMAQDLGAHAPEVTQFRIEDLPGDPFAAGEVPEPPTKALEEYEDAARRLLAEAITHLGLIQIPSTKLSGTLIREYDYMLHPIFSALFSYSYRRKRKMSLTSTELLNLISDPHRTIREVLDRNNRTMPGPHEELPEQMRLFERYLREPA